MKAHSDNSDQTEATAVISMLNKQLSMKPPVKTPNSTAGSSRILPLGKLHLQPLHSQPKTASKLYEVPEGKSHSSGGHDPLTPWSRGENMGDNRDHEHDDNE